MTAASLEATGRAKTPSAADVRRIPSAVVDVQSSLPRPTPVRTGSRRKLVMPNWASPGPTARTSTIRFSVPLMAKPVSADPPGRTNERLEHPPNGESSVRKTSRNERAITPLGMVLGGGLNAGSKNVPVPSFAGLKRKMPECENDPASMKLSSAVWSSIRR